MTPPPAARRTTALRGFAALLLVAGALVGSAWAYVQSSLVDLGFFDVGLHVGASDTIVLRLEQDAAANITNGTDITALTDSMARWTNIGTSAVTVSDGTRFNFASPIDAATGLNSGDGANRVFFAETDAQNRVGGAIAAAFFSVSVDGTILDCDIVFNDRLYTFSTTTPANPNQSLGSGTYDIGEIATHEIGHCLGLDHSPVAGRFSATTGLQVSGFSSFDFTHQATMYPYGTGTIQGRSLAQDDISGAGFIYPNTALNTTTGTIRGRVLHGGDFTPVRGANVVAVTTAAPDVPLVGVLSDVEPGTPAGTQGGEFTIVGLPPGGYYLRIEPMVGSTNPFTEENTFFTGFDVGFPWEYYNGAAESGSDVATDRTAISLVAGQTVAGIDILTNVAAPDPNEPNDTRASATSFGCERTTSGSIVPKTDVDFYAVPIAEPSRFTIDVSAGRIGSPLDAVVGLFDAAGTLLASADNTAGIDPILFFDLYAAGTYYIAVASAGDGDFNGSGGTTLGNYSLGLQCSLPRVRAGTCPGRVLFAGSLNDDSIVALSDENRDLIFDGQTSFANGVGSGQGRLARRRDGGVSLGSDSGALGVLCDDTGDFISDRSVSHMPGLSDAAPVASLRRGAAEYLYTGSAFDGARVLELVDTDGDGLPERTTTFSDLPGYVYDLALDEAGTVYVYDATFNTLGGILALRDEDGDGVAERSSVFLASAFEYAGIVGRGAGEIFAIDFSNGEVDRIVDHDGDGVADGITTFASGLTLDATRGITVDDADVIYVFEGGNRILALADDDRDGVADRQSQFSPLNTGYGGLAFGIGPPEAVSAPSSFRPVTVAPSGSGMLRLTWEDQGPGIAAYNIHQGTIGGFYSHAPLLCHVAGFADGAGGRFLDITPGAGDGYFLVTASDACGEGSAGRASSGGARPLPGGTCGAAAP